MLARRLEVLSDGQKVDRCCAQIVHQLHHLVALLAQTHHHARLGEQERIELFHPLQQAQRGEVARAWPHREIERRHGLEIVVEHVGPRGDDSLECPLLAQEVRREHLDGRRGRTRADRADHLGEMPGAAIEKIITIDRSHHDMYEPELRDRIGKALRLIAVERTWQAGLDVAVSSANREKKMASIGRRYPARTRARSVNSPPLRQRRDIPSTVSADPIMVTIFGFSPGKGRMRLAAKSTTWCTGRWL